MAQDVVAGLPQENLREVLQMALASERGDWDKLLKTSLPPDTFEKNYIEAIRWTSEVSATLQK